MINIDTALREMTETEEAVANMLLSDSFFNELSRIRLDLGVSPHLPISNEMCKWVVLAYLRSSQEYATNSKLVLSALQDNVAFIVEHAVKEEREACAKVCEDIDTEYEGEDVLATWCAAAIRARGKE